MLAQTRNCSYNGLQHPELLCLLIDILLGVETRLPEMVTSGYRRRTRISNKFIDRVDSERNHSAALPARAFAGRAALTPSGSNERGITQEAAGTRRRWARPQTQGVVGELRPVVDGK